MAWFFQGSISKGVEQHDPLEADLSSQTFDDKSDLDVSLVAVSPPSPDTQQLASDETGTTVSSLADEDPSWLNISSPPGSVPSKSPALEAGTVALKDESSFEGIGAGDAPNTALRKSASSKRLSRNLRQRSSSQQLKQGKLNMARLPIAIIEQIVTLLKLHERTQTDTTSNSTTPSKTPDQPEGKKQAVVKTSINCLMVNKHWSMAASRALYTQPYLPTLNHLLSLLSTALSPSTIHPYTSLVKYLDLPPALAHDIDLGDLDIALQLFPTLEKLSLHGGPPTATNVLLQSISDHAQGLKKLEIRGCPVSDVMVKTLVENCVLLKYVDLSETSVTVASIETLATHLQLLSTLKLECAGPDPQLLNVATASTVNAPFISPMAYVDLSHSGVHDVHLRRIAESCHSTLQVLVVSGCAALTDDSLSRVSRLCRSLRSWDVSFIPAMSDLTLFALGLSTPAPPPPAKDGTSDDAAPASILQKQPTFVLAQIESLNVSGCDRITPEGVVALLPKFPQGGFPSNSGASTPTSAGSPLFRRSVMQPLPGSKKSELAATEATAGCPRLKELALHGCAGILPSYVRQFAVGKTWGGAARLSAAAGVGELDCLLKEEGLRLLAAYDRSNRGNRGGMKLGLELEMTRLASATSMVASPASESGSTPTMEKVSIAIQTDPMEIVSSPESATAVTPTAATAAEAAKEGSKDASSSLSAETLLMKFAEAIAIGTWRPPGMPPATPGAAAPSMQPAGYWPGYYMPYGAPPGAMPPPGMPGYPSPPQQPVGSGLPKPQRLPIARKQHSDEDFDETPYTDPKRLSSLSSTSTSSTFSSASAMAAARSERDTSMTRNPSQSNGNRLSFLPAPTRRSTVLYSTPSQESTPPTTPSMSRTYSGSMRKPSVAYARPGARPSASPGGIGATYGSASSLLLSANPSSSSRIAAPVRGFSFSPNTGKPAASVSPSSPRNMISPRGGASPSSSPTVSRANSGYHHPGSMLAMPTPASASPSYKPRQFKKFNTDVTDAVIAPPPRSRVLGGGGSGIGTSSTNNNSTGGSSSPPGPSSASRLTAGSRSTKVGKDKAEEDRLLQEFAATLPNQGAAFRRSVTSGGMGGSTGNLQERVSSTSNTSSNGAGGGGSGKLPRKSVTVLSGSRGSLAGGNNARTSVSHPLAPSGSSAGWIPSGGASAAMVSAALQENRWSVGSGSSQGSNGSSGGGSRLPMPRKK